MIVIGNKKLSLEDFEKILYEDEKIEIDASALERVNASFEFLKAFSRDKVIYGINTGLGPMAQYKINDDDCRSLQYNLIRSHSSGSGEPIPERYIRSAMIARLNTLMQGYSGVHQEVTEKLRDFINAGITPIIFEHGGVGASGDLVQLSHLALGLIGEGEAYYKEEIVPIADAMKENNISPISMHIREGLALINGTSAMSGIGIINIINAKSLLNWSVRVSSLLNELAESFDDHFSEELHSVKHHIGQQTIAASMRKNLQDSRMIRKRDDHFYNGKINDGVLRDKVQEYYSLRCIPQILGPVLEVIDNAEQTLIGEVNSANDNPIIDVKTNNVYHGGNFHGDYVALEMDKLKISVTKMSMLLERQINFLMNSKLNEKLPPFVNLGTLGLNLGMQGVQFTATSTVAENQTLSFPMYLHSIPNNNDNQDIVSMGANAALMTKKIISNTFEVLAIEIMALVQAVDYLECYEKLSSTSKELFDDIRSFFPVFKEDSIKYRDIQNVKLYLLEARLI